LAEAHKAKLSNGLEVVLAEAASIPKFHGELFFRSGNAAVADRARDSRNDRNGGSDGNSEAREPPDRRRFAAHRGGSFFERRSGHQRDFVCGPFEFAEPLLGMVNELAREAAFPEAEFERERRQKLEEVKLERTQPGFLASERLRKVLLARIPTRSFAERRASCRVQARRFAKSISRCLHAGERAVVARRRFDSQAMMQNVEKVFGVWTGKKPETKTAASPAHPRGRRVYLCTCPARCNTDSGGMPRITRKNPDWVKVGLTNSLYAERLIRAGDEHSRGQRVYVQPRSGVHALRQHGYFSVSAAVRNDVVAASLTEIF